MNKLVANIDSCINNILAGENSTKLLTTMTASS